MIVAVEEIEHTVEQLSSDQLRKFRVWYEKFDSKAWDEQLEEDIYSGKLDALADVAITDHKMGRSKRL